MGISLSKGGNLSLSKEAGSTGLAKLTVGLGWDTRVTDGPAFDLDASAFLLNDMGKVRSDADFIYYNQPKSTCGSVESMGDNKTGSGDGDDEQIKVDVTKVPSSVQKIAFTVTIYESETRKLNFGMVTNAFIRVVNDIDGKELVRFDLGEDYSTETAVIFGELYRNGAEWKFKAVGQGFGGGLAALSKSYGAMI